MVARKAFMPRNLGSIPSVWLLAGRVWIRDGLAIGVSGWLVWSAMARDKDIDREAQYTPLPKTYPSVA